MKGKTGKIPQPGDPQGKYASDKAPTDVYAGEDSNVLKEAKKRKKGGRIRESEGTKEYDKMKRECHASGGAAVSRGDRSPRKRGGRAMGGVMSEAHHLTNREGSKGLAPAKD